MNWSELAKKVSQWLIDETISRIDAATVQRILRYGVEQLKALASETSTPIDDWAVAQIESWIEDQAKIEQIRAFIVDKLNHLCASNGDEYQALADSLSGVEPGKPGGPITNVILAKILETVLEAVVKYFTEKNQ